MKYRPQTTLTQAGSNIDLERVDVKSGIMDKARMYWEQQSVKNINRGQMFAAPNEQIPG